MVVREWDTSPDTLVGAVSCGVLVVDQDDSVVLINRQAAKLLRARSNLRLGDALKDTFPALAKTPLSTDEHLVTLGSERCVAVRSFTPGPEGSRLRILSIRDGSTRQALEKARRHAEDEARQLRLEADKWSTCLALVKSVEESAPEEESAGRFLDLAPIVARTLFPEGGSLSLTAEGRTVDEAWGDDQQEPFVRVPVGTRGWLRATGKDGEDPARLRAQAELLALTLSEALDS